MSDNRYRGRTRARRHPLPTPAKRPTLAPLVPWSEMEHSSLFHRALHVFNVEHMRLAVWDELTVAEQEEVRSNYRELQRRATLCGLGSSSSAT